MSLLLNGLLILCLQAAGTGAEAASGVNQAQPPAAAAPGAPAAEQAAPAAAPAAAQPPAVTAAPADPAAAASPPVTAPADATTAAAAGEVTTSEEKSLPPAATGPGGFVILLLVLAILILPFVIGSFVAKSLNVPEWSSRIGVVILTLLLGISPFLMSLLKGQPLSERFRLGIDLAGGTNMVFQVRGEGKEITPSVMDQMVGAVSRRINQSGTEEITVRAVGTDRIEVIVPGEDPQTVDDIKRRITRLGSLEFFTVANRADSDIIRLAQGLDLSRKEVVINGEVRARWVPAAEKNGEPKLLTDSDVISRPLKAEREVNGRVESYDTQEYLLLVSPKEEQVTGQYLRSAVRDFDPQNGEIVVSFAFDQTGAYLFGQLTGRNVPRDGVPNRRLAIVLDGRVDSAPFIREQITSRGQISGGQGGFTAEEAGELVAVLNAGALEVPIDPKPLSEATVDPTLGADVRQKGVTATAISGLAVIVFMLVYYRFAGVIAVISLILNLVLTVGLMVAIPATFTLPGIAGLVLTIGMAVDANVLIYERMREEIDRGSSTRIAIQNGFEKAFITIFDSNVTTLLTSVVLFYFGTDQIRGFAVTLFIGLAVSMYTALYVGRLLFDLSERCGLLKQISMMRAIGETNLDFMKYRNQLFTVSGVLIATGLLFFAMRGEKNYDIDFTGGTMVAFQTTEPQKTDDVSAVLQQEFGDDFALERLSVGEESGEGTGKYFRLRTTDREVAADGAEAQVSSEDRVRERVNKAFSG
ncbi:MAG: protein translocase subunit SecD, partial [Planctomyces sp.]